MKLINFTLIRTVIAFIIGLVLIVWPDAAADYLVITIGILFIIPGLIGTIGYFAAGSSASRFPIEAVGSFLLGLWLVIMPGFFVNILMYLLGFILLLGGLHQMYTLMIARKLVGIPIYFFIISALVFIAALYIIFSPRESQRTLFIIIGVTSIVYAISDLFNYFKFRNRKTGLPANSTDVVDIKILDD